MPLLSDDTVVVLYAHSRGSRGSASLACDYAGLLTRHGCPVRAIDVLNTDRGPVSFVVETAYTLMLAHFPNAWRFLYSSWARLPGLEAVRRRGIAWRFREARRMLTAAQPPVVVALHPYATAIASSLKAQGKLRAHLMVVLGGWHVQPFWCFPEVDHYLVSTARQRDTLMAMGIPAGCVTVSGLMAAPEYKTRVPRAKARTTLGLPLDRPVLLAMGGAGGWRLEKILGAIRELETPVCAVFLCGNRKKQAELERRLSVNGSGRAEIRLLPFEPEPSLYFHAADLIVTKPGRLTTAQAFACGAPVLAVEPLPAHEEASLRELLRDRAVLVQAPGESLAAAIERLLRNAAAREEAAEAAGRLMAPDTAKIVLQTLEAVMSHV